MGREIEVVYEKGVFKPLVPIQLEEGHHLKLYIPYEPRKVSREQVLKELRELHEVFAELSDEDWAEIEQAWKRGK
jgi:predicted DNA-binding antitoxin AbrB/MazE fold protein